MEGCPGHKGILNYQSVSDAYSFSMNGRILHFERGELEAMIALLQALNRIDAIEITRLAPTDAEVEAAAKRAAGAGWLVDGERLDRSWDMAPEAVREHFRRMARAALGVVDTP